VGGEFSPHTPEQFTAYALEDAAKWRKVITQLGLKLD
jgi:hypothetical protein